MQNERWYAVSGPIFWKKKEMSTQVYKQSSAAQDDELVQSVCADT
jgi:hypothetical protein